ncbi:hypothetical protein [Aporhodopirellula aestuarii]|uniref:Uncharacterized protein n=1 Tax=Aporhodopirellula aestuarii TaxID=2950107 RepID=A0ABT0U8S6_9BACT|nr:hypothetical protein [Aporhodopirellula aestuarii]MCM2373293.1 hypothetical protein [Aporhodopirellula aestuarii]
MRSFTMFLVLASPFSIGAALSERANAADELFSKVTMETVFTDIKAQETKKEKTNPISSADRERAARIAALFEPAPSDPPPQEVSSPEPTPPQPVKQTVVVAQPPPESTKQAAAISPQPSFALTGRWAASTPGGDVFAIAFTAEKQFILVHMKGGKSSVSKGKFATEGDRLDLIGANTSPLKAEITWSDADKFTMALGEARLNFERKK